MKKFKNYAEVRCSEHCSESDRKFHALNNADDVVINKDKQNQPQVLERCAIWSSHHKTFLLQHNSRLRPSCTDCPDIKPDDKKLFFQAIDDGNGVFRISDYEGQNCFEPKSKTENYLRKVKCSNAAKLKFIIEPLNSFEGEY